MSTVPGSALKVSAKPVHGESKVTSTEILGGDWLIMILVITCVSDSPFKEKVTLSPTAIFLSTSKAAWFPLQPVSVFVEPAR